MDQMRYVKIRSGPTVTFEKHKHKYDWVNIGVTQILFPKFTLQMSE